MSNTYFRFKQFIVEQDKCAMKVCTDACILGAIADAKGAVTMLDIGTGTGLLSLMMAQRFRELKVDAIEIESSAAQQAGENFEKSLWSKQLVSICGDIRNITLTKKYDHVISNPPFYDVHLKPENSANKIARHNEQLTLKELAEIVHQCLLPNGKFSILLPPGEMNQLKKILLSKKIYLNKQLLISDRKTLPVIRVVGEFGFDDKPTDTASLIIKEDEKNYTNEFIHLLKDFYLAF